MPLLYLIACVLAAKLPCFTLRLRPQPFCGWVCLCLYFDFFPFPYLGEFWVHLLTRTVELDLFPDRAASLHKGPGAPISWSSSPVGFPRAAASVRNVGRPTEVTKSDFLSLIFCLDA